MTLGLVDDCVLLTDYSVDGYGLLGLDYLLRVLRHYVGLLLDVIREPHSCLGRVFLVITFLRHNRAASRNHHVHVSIDRDFEYFGFLFYAVLV